MSARVDSDEDGGGKAINKKALLALLAITSAESTLIESMTEEMLNGERRFDAEKFVEVFRKYTPHFVQLLSAESSDDSDEEDGDPFPNKYIPFLTAFAKSKDKFVAAIENNYKVLCKKDLKDLDFSVFISHPEEIFKSYAKSIGFMAQSSPVFSQNSQSNVHQPSSALLKDNNGENIGRSLGAIDDSLRKLNVNDVSVDTDHGSLLSAQEEELRKTIESESDTPTPTIEDWKGAGERSKERAMNKTPTDRCIDSSMEGIINWSGKPIKEVPDAVPLMVPQIGQKPSHPIFPSESTGGHSIHNHSPHVTLPTHVHLSGQSQNCGPSLPPCVNSLLREVHQDLRFALPPMMERAVRAYLKEKRLLTLSEFIGEEFMDDKLVKFMVKMLSKDNAFMRILSLEITSDGDHLVRLRQLIPMEFKDSEIVGREAEKEKDGGTEERRDAASALPTTISRLGPVNQDDIEFFPDPANLPCTIEEGECDVNTGDPGTLAVALDGWNKVLERQLKDLVELDMDHLNLSNAHQLKKGLLVILKSNQGSYCRGLIQEEWTRDSHGIEAHVKCFLIDFGMPIDIPIEAIYALPNLTGPFPPATAFYAKLAAYPIGAKIKSDEFSESVWKDITDVLNEWKAKGLLAVQILGFNEDNRWLTNEDKFVIDVKNGQGESLRDELVKRGLVQKVLTPLLSNSRELPPSYQPLDFQSDERNASQRDGGLKNMVKAINSCQTIPTSMNVLDGSAATPSSLIVGTEESVRRNFIEIPLSAAAPSLLHFIVQPSDYSYATSSDSSLTARMNTRKPGRPLVQIVDDCN